MTLCRFPMATACSPAASAPTTARNARATVIPMSGGSTKRQVQLMRDFGATVLCCTPSYALHLHDAGLEIGINIKDLPLRLGVFGAEPWTEEMRREIEDKLGITATNIYGLSEIMGPGVSQSCAKEQQLSTFGKTISCPKSRPPPPAEVLPEGSTRRAGHHHADPSMGHRWSVTAPATSPR